MEWNDEMLTLCSSNENSEQTHPLNDVHGKTACPKCYKEQPESDECIYCGVIFTKYLKIKARAEQKSVEEEAGLTDSKSPVMLKKVLICFFIIQLSITVMSCIHDWCSWERYMANAKRYEGVKYISSTGSFCFQDSGY